MALLRDLPEIQALETYRPKQPTRIVDREGRLLKTLYEERREWVGYAQFPRPLVQAITSIEDRKFFEHSGLDWRGIARALFVAVRDRRITQGGSTLTQQLAKSLFLSPEKSLERKLREAWLSYQIERRYSKERILELYLNQIYLGDGNYGVAAAARSYFDKPLGDLTIEEAALIAGLPQAPSAYNPRVHPDKAKVRRNQVLDAMAATGALPSGMASSLKETPIRLARKTEVAEAPYFVETVRRQLEREFTRRFGDTRGDSLLYGGGLTVHTTIDLDAQQAAEHAVWQGLQELRERQKMPEATDFPLKDWPQGALLAQSVKTGDVLAWVGGTDYALTPFNRVNQALRQPGSAIKPVIYAAALLSGWTQAGLLDDSPLIYFIGNKEWTPDNYDGEFEGWMTLRYALQKSKNIPAIRLLEQVGHRPVQRLARRMGIASPIHPNLASALGASETTLSELVQAYGTFASGGTTCKARRIDRVENPEGLVIYEDPHDCRPVLQPQEAYLMVDLLRNVIAEGTGRSARGLQSLAELGGKTGTTNDNVDAWFVGFSPQWVVGTWTGFDTPRTLGPNETGGHAALPAWKYFMEGLLTHMPGETEFAIPPGIHFVEMDPLTGDPASDGQRAAFVGGQPVASRSEKGIEKALARWDARFEAFEDESPIMEDSQPSE